jgi:hypothetical protein
MIDTILVIIFIAAIALMWNEGCWSNCLMLVNVTVAGIVALNFYEPLADYFESLDPTFTYVVDFLALWTLFAVTAGVMRAITDSLCKTKVRFQTHVEQVGRVVLGAWIAFSLAGFCALTLHAAPLPLNGFRGSFDRKPNEGMMFGLAPDRAWLGFMQALSQGAYGWEDEKTNSRYPTDGKLRVFDPQSEFLVKYRSRRIKLEDAVNKAPGGEIRVNRAGQAAPAP